MKSFLAVLTFASLVLIAVFGFAAMSHGAGHCIASAVQGAVCPNNDLFGFASFHIGFFKNFGNAAFKSLLAGITLLALALLTLLLKSPEFSGLGLREATFQRTGGSEFVTSSIKNNRRWLSLLETSPTLSLALR